MPPEQPAPRWRYWVLGVDAAGRVALPPGARGVANAGGEVRAVSRGAALALRSGGTGAVVPVDGRGRVLLPAGWRRYVGPARSVLVAAALPDASLVVVSPVGSLDAVVDALVKGVA